jgi:hypothetical protein
MAVLNVILVIILASLRPVSLGPCEVQAAEYHF